MNLGKKIKKARTEKGLTQKQLAEEILKRGQKASNTTIANWESGLNSPDIETLQTICDILGKDGNYFFDFTNTKCGNSDIYTTLREDSEPYYTSLGDLYKDKVPLLGTVKAGYDYLANENILDYVSISFKKEDNNYYALKIKRRQYGNCNV